MEYKHEFVIDESRWLHGTEIMYDSTQLLDRKGNMCCLGHFAISCGLAPSAILNIGAPMDVEKDKRTELFNSLLFREADRDAYSIAPTQVSAVSDLIEANDDCMLMPERKERITELFADLGVKVTFVPGPVTDFTMVVA